jgi:hypothetical protein
MSAASGKGQLRMQKGTLSGLSPVAVREAADAYLAEEIPQKDRLVSRINTGLRKGSIPYPAITAPVAVKDGVLRLQDVGLDGTDYAVKAGLMVDLASLRLDSEWEVAYSGKSKSGEKLPAVHLVFAGPVAQFASLQPQISTEQLERYLSMRRMEQDMDRLEKLSRPGAPLRDGGKVRSSTNSITNTRVEAVTGAEQTPSQPPPDASKTLAPSNPPPDGSKTVAPSNPPPASEEDKARSTATGEEKPPTGWSTGTEEAPSAEANQSANRDSGDFEARIRNAIGRSPAY